MTSLYLWDGKLLRVDGELAAHEDCCCPPTYPCDGCDEDTTPQSLMLEIAGLSGICSPLNDTWELQRVSPETLPCTYSLYLEVSAVEWISIEAILGGSVACHGSPPSGKSWIDVKVTRNYYGTNYTVCFSYEFTYPGTIDCTAEYELTCHFVDCSCSGVTATIYGTL